MTITVHDAMRLNGIEDLTLTTSQQKYLVESTEDLLRRHPKEWFLANQQRLKMELEQVFNEI